jgi:ABC-type transporter lipoprotein component MlaA
LKLSSGKPDCLTPVQARDPWRGHSNETITNTNPQIDRVQARPVLES